MTKKQRNTPKESFSNPLDTLGNQPDGENFFAFAVVIDDPTNPNWNYGQSCIGPWDKAKALAGAFVTAWCADQKRLGNRIQVAMFQGDGARAYLSHSIKEEARYQQEIAKN